MKRERDLQGESGGGYDNFGYVNTNSLTTPNNSISETLAIDINGSRNFTGKLQKKTNIL